MHFSQKGEQLLWYAQIHPHPALTTREASQLFRLWWGEILTNPLGLKNSWACQTFQSSWQLKLMVGFLFKAFSTLAPHTLWSGWFFAVGVGGSLYRWRMLSSIPSLYPLVVRSTHILCSSLWPENCLQTFLMCPEGWGKIVPRWEPPFCSITPGLTLQVDPTSPPSPAQAHLKFCSSYL